MKGLLIASDLMLDEAGEPKIIEMNTNGGIFDSMINQLNYDELVNLWINNSITEVHYMWNTTNVVVDINNKQSFEINLSLKLQELCIQNNIQYFSYELNENAVSVPFIEDTPNKFILRQSYDATALIDEVYCADKKNLIDLVKDEPFAVQTYAANDDFVINTLSQLGTEYPNVIMKYRFPFYQVTKYPALYKIENQQELDSLKTAIPENYFIQEFVNSENNIVEGKYGIIRSIDIVYGGNLDLIHLGSYHNTSGLNLNVWPDEHDPVTKEYTNKSRIKWVSKRGTEFQENIYHLDEDNKIVGIDGSLLTLPEISQGMLIRSLQFSNLPTENDVDLNSFTSTLQETMDTMVVNNASVVSLKSSTLETVYVRVTLSDGTVWDDSVNSRIYVELKDSLITKFKTINAMEVGDKVIVLNNQTNELVTREITDLTVIYDDKKIYELDVEEQDVFISVLNEEQNYSLIQHNPCWCNGWNCGTYSCASYCSQCASCFSGDALIDTPEGLKKIEDLKIGDYVASYEIDEGKVVVKQIKGVYKKEYDGNLLIINGYETKATIGHPFAVKTKNNELKWAAYDPSADKEFHTVQVIQLLEGEHYINVLNDWALIEKIELVPYKGNVYNISVEETHNYFAENILVHNVENKEKKSFN
jgi:hypothetical protein